MTQVEMTQVEMTQVEMTQARVAPFYCPYCGEEDLRPAEEPHAAWRCADCQRVFVVRLVGLVTPTREVAR